jgi:hypothetical protein
MKNKKGLAALGVAGLFFLLAGTGWDFAQYVSLTGRVHHVDKPGLTLDKKIEAAVQEFRKENREGLFLTGYVFPARDSIHMDDRRGTDAPYGVRVREGEIRIRRTLRDKSGDSYSVHTEADENGPAGLFLLYRMSGARSRIVDSSIFDPDRSYTFEDTPLYWLGEADAEESFALLKDAFGQSGSEIRNNLVFVISRHDCPRVTPFLKDVALGEHVTKVRKNAIFWLGHKASDEAAKVLKGVVEGSDEDDDIKKAAVFAISQLPKERSIPLLISIAKTNQSAALRKSAIFWLGQTGDEEALQFFEEILLKK